MTQEPLTFPEFLAKAECVWPGSRSKVRALELSCRNFTQRSSNGTAWTVAEVRGRVYAAMVAGWTGDTVLGALCFLQEQRSK